MQMRMRLLPLKHDICYAQHFAKIEVELFVKTVNDLKLLKQLWQKGPPWVCDRVLSTHLLSLSFTYERGQGSRSRSVA